MRFMIAVVIASCVVVFALALTGCVAPAVPTVVAVAPPAAVREPPPAAVPPIVVPPPAPLTPPVIAPTPTVARAPSPAPKTVTVSKAPPPAPAKAAPPATLDLTSLETRLRATSAIGTFTKLSLKNQVSDLIDQFKTFHHGGTPAVATLRQKYDLLLLKFLSLLQDDDASLAGAISASRESIWGILVDPVKFAKLG